MLLVKQLHHKTEWLQVGFDSLPSLSSKPIKMELTIEKERAKNFLSCEVCNKYTITTTVNGIVYSQAYYGYPKRMAISEFKKYVKNEVKSIA